LQVTCEKGNNVVQMCLVKHKIKVFLITLGEFRLSLGKNIRWCYSN